MAAKNENEETVTIKKEDLATMIAATIKAVKEEEKKEKEPGIINNFFYGAKAAVRGVSEFASEKVEKASKATKRERAIAEYLKGKNEEMEDFIKTFKDEPPESEKKAKK